MWLRWSGGAQYDCNPAHMVMPMLCLKLRDRHGVLTWIEMDMDIVFGGKETEDFQLCHGGLVAFSGVCYVMVALRVNVNCGLTSLRRTISCSLEPRDWMNE